MRSILMQTRSVRSIIKILAITTILMLSSGCAHDTVWLDKYQVLFKDGDRPRPLEIPCNGGIEVVHEHGLYWWPGGWYKAEDHYGIYFKNSLEFPGEFYLTMNKYYEHPRTVTARGTVIVEGRNVNIDLEYQNAKAKWRKLPINGLRKIDLYRKKNGSASREPDESVKL